MSQLPNDKTDKISLADSRSFDAIRLLANYMIVLMHAWAASQYCAEVTIEFSVWNYLCNSFAAAAMPALFLMSGYLLMVDFTPQVVRGKFYRRFKRLLVPLLAWNLFFVVFYLTLSRFVPRISARVASFNLETIGGVMNKVIGLIDRPLDAPLWYLKTVFIYSLFAIPVWWVLQKRKAHFLYLISLIVLVASVFTPLGQPMKYSFPAYSVFAFLMGCHLGYKKVSVFKMFSNKIWLICPLIGSVMVYAWLVATHGQYEIWRDIGFILMLPFLFSIGPCLAQYFEKIRCYPFALRSSFFVYAGHFLFCSILLHVFAGKIIGNCGNGQGILTGLIAIFCFAGVGLNLLAYKLGKACLGKWFGIWDGSL